MSAPVAIALVGAAGRMGLAITRVATARPEVIVVAAVDHPSCDRLGRDLGELADVGELGVTVSAELAPALDRAEAVVDLSHPDAAAGVIEATATAGVPLVCGTTGLAGEAHAALDRAASRIPVLYTPNLSPGIAVMTSLLKRAAISPDHIAAPKRWTPAAPERDSMNGLRVRPCRSYPRKMLSSHLKL